MVAVLPEEPDDLLSVAFHTAHHRDVQVSETIKLFYFCIIDLVSKITTNAISDSSTIEAPIQINNFCVKNDLFWVIN